MQTRLPEPLLATDAGREADQILRACVHCGFCTATCPTYQLLGDELDGPRGRIWLIKELLERDEAGPSTRRHLDRCLTCRACETTCPSGVRYGRLLEIGREALEERLPRTLGDRLLRGLLIAVIPYPARFRLPLRIAQLLRPALPRGLRERVPPRQRVQRPDDAVRPVQPRRVLLLAGCVQSLATPATNLAAARVLAHLGIDGHEASRAGCCGALPLHLSERERARVMARRNIDAWWPHLEDGAEAIVMTASGCGVTVREYDALLADDPAYAERAARVAASSCDIAEFLAKEDLGSLRLRQPMRVAWHSPCTLQHGQGVIGAVEQILDGVGAERVPVADGHLCCGSAGTYSILQPALSRSLRDRKLAALEAAGPELVVTANVGCQTHLAGAADLPVKHWLELLAEALPVTARRG
ncbi:MAG: glycolate oxidase subunit GlcF [Pseudomonadales bacterium]|jgi:glycolate oxidase iron-sulfur subunit|nr:glycolate oxidase subunit GlcF [Pseudomonadales bacterium]